MQEMRKEWLEDSPMLEVIERRLAICRCLLFTLGTGFVGRACSAVKVSRPSSNPTLW